MSRRIHIFINVLHRPDTDSPHRQGMTELENVIQKLYIVIMNLLIADTSPLIFLAKLALLETVVQNFKLITTSVVFEEATRRKEFVDAGHICRVVESGGIMVETAAVNEVREMSGFWGLGKGEASVLVAVATRQNGSALIDDYAALTVCRTQGFSYTTTPVLIYEMGRRKLISRKQAKNKLIALGEYAWMSEEVIGTVLSWLDKGV